MLRVYNTLARKKVIFKPKEKGLVRMYVCGPTVYGPAHIGHARTYVAFDIIRRYFEWKGFEVKLVVNITDVHDDMIRVANEQGKTIFELSKQYTELFFKDMKALKVKEASVYPKVSREIPDIIETIKLLEKKGYAYATEDGLYFDISRFKGYGKLSGIKPKQSITGTRVETDKYDKRQAHDFALWKKVKPNEPFWDSPWGPGRPGWHIECTTMSSKYLGLPLDIHCGAVDLVFPHHENEIAQSEAAYGTKPFVKYWLHTGFLTINAQKMSKSLGNYITVPELLSRIDPNVFRFFIAVRHYRSRVDYSDFAIEQAKNALQRLNDFIQRLYAVEHNNFSNEATNALKLAKKEFEKAMDDDFNTPLAWKVIFTLENKINIMLGKGILAKNNAKEIIAFFKDINSIFEVFETDKKTEDIPQECLEMIMQREKLRKEKRFEEADDLRAKLAAKGIAVFDTPQGPQWKKITTNSKDSKV
ncbi:MAG: cysteine--tRNA ligase [Candidatus Diapherotrites archaeon]|nr:cysteine--tRNA ligase [Candidatus Diapherotrites archaeon]